MLANKAGVYQRELELRSPGLALSPVGARDQDRGAGTGESGHVATLQSRGRDRQGKSWWQKWAASLLPCVSWAPPSSGLRLSLAVLLGPSAGPPPPPFLPFRSGRILFPSAPRGGLTPACPRKEPSGRVSWNPTRVCMSVTPKFTS